MRKISAAIVAALFAILSFGASAATVGSSVEGVKSPSTFTLIAKKAKTYKKASYAKKKYVKAKKVSKGGKKGGGRKGPGRCGTGMFYSKGKCAAAADKKTS